MPQINTWHTTVEKPWFTRKEKTVMSLSKQKSDAKTSAMMMSDKSCLAMKR